LSTHYRTFPVFAVMPWLSWRERTDGWQDSDLEDSGSRRTPDPGAVSTHRQPPQDPAATTDLAGGLQTGKVLVLGANRGKRAIRLTDDECSMDVAGGHGTIAIRPGSSIRLRRANHAVARSVAPQSVLNPSAPNRHRSQDGQTTETPHTADSADGGLLTYPESSESHC